jgi:hypothetical protein
MKLPLCATLCACLWGCASPTDVGTRLLNEGAYTAAEQQLMIGANHGDGVAWNNLGVLYERQGRRQESVRALVMAARYGNAVARNTLAVRGLPVPPADLVAVQPSGGPAAVMDVMGGILDGYQQRQANTPIYIDLGRSNGITCTSRPSAAARGVVGDVTTDCR